MNKKQRYEQLKRIIDEITSLIIDIENSKLDDKTKILTKLELAKISLAYLLDII